MRCPPTRRTRAAEAVRATTRPLSHPNHNPNPDQVGRATSPAPRATNHWARRQARQLNLTLILTLPLTSTLALALTPTRRRRGGADGHVLRADAARPRGLRDGAGRAGAGAACCGRRRQALEDPPAARPAAALDGQWHLGTWGGAPRTAAGRQDAHRVHAASRRRRARPRTCRRAHAHAHSHQLDVGRHAELQRAGPLSGGLPSVGEG